MSNIDEKRIREIVREELGAAFASLACINPPKPIIRGSERRVVALALRSAVQAVEKSGGDHFLRADKPSKSLSEIPIKSSNSSANAGSRSSNSRASSPSPSDLSLSATARTEAEEASSPDFLKANASKSAEIKTSSSDVVSESVSIFTGIANLFRWIGRLLCIESRRGGKQ